MLKSTQSILAFNSSDIAQTRLKIIEFHNQYRTKITIDAFGISKATIYRWKKKLKDNQGRLEWIIWYNTKRVHKSLNNVSPVNYLLKNLPEESHMDVTYTRC